MLEKLYSMIRSDESNKKDSDIKLEVPVPDFIPYACHWDGDTILTKNGELVQIIRVTGFSSDSVGSEELDLRYMLRKAIRKYIKTDDFALWIHTIRRKDNLDPGGDFPVGFSYGLNKAWKANQKWAEAYVNEVYVTVLRGGMRAGLDGKQMGEALYFKRLKDKHDAALEAGFIELKAAVEGILKVLAPFGAHKLCTYKSGRSYNSELLEFFAKLLSLSQVQVPLPISDLSETLASNQVAIGFDTMEVRGAGGKRFGAICSMKEYIEIPPESLDLVLQLPQEFIITQTLDFIDSKAALAQFKRQHYLLQIGRDETLSEEIGLNALMTGNDGGVTEFGNSQITLFMLDSDAKKLPQNVAAMAAQLRAIGVVAPRRDVRLEECFWAQLPGNFSFVTRKKPISTSLVGGFASLYNFPSGRRMGNHWGPAVTLFYTTMGTPYFFNFHIESNGHSLILGPYGMGKTVLLNFLVSEARKFHGRLLFFDNSYASKVFIRALGGDYTEIRPDVVSDDCRFNPFVMEDKPANRAFLKRWMVLLAGATGQEVSEAERVHLGKLVDYIYTLSPEKRRLSAVAPSFGEDKPGSLGEKMAPWHGSGRYAHLFDNESAGIVNLNALIAGFEMGHVVEDGVTLGPVLSYLFHRIEDSLDGVPTMIVLDEAWKLVNNELFAPQLADWLDRMREKNAMVIFATETVQNDGKQQMTQTVVEKISTFIFLPNFDAQASSRAYKELWGLSDDEFALLAKMRVEKHQFMLRQGGSSVVVNLDLAGFKEVAVLSGSDKTVMMMEELVTAVGESPEDWLPEFYART